jgi:chaperonin cofactor prefoldin
MTLHEQLIVLLSEAEKVLDEIREYNDDSKLNIIHYTISNFIDEDDRKLLETLIEESARINTVLKL